MSSASPSEVTEGLLQPFGHGTGYPEKVAPANPSAGAEFSYKVTGFYWERLVAVTLTLAAAGGGSARSVVLEVLDEDGGVLAAIPAAATQASGVSRTYTYLPNMNAVLGPIGTTFFSPLPLFFLQPTWKLVTSTLNKTSSDQFSAIRLYRERFSTGPDGYPIGRTVLSRHVVPVRETPPSS